jgi:DNA polymerase-4
MGQALRLCPGLIILPPNYAAYRAYSEKVMAILGERTALVEQLSIDEAFLDVTDLPEPGETLARTLQQEIRERLGLPCSLGVAANKLLAKTATDVGKGRHRGAYPPCAVEVVPPGEEAAYLAPLPVEALWGVGPKTARRLAELGIHTIGELALMPEAVLARQFGQNGRDMFHHAQGIDARPVTPERAAVSISQEITFDRDVSRAAALQDTLRTLSEAVARMLREKDLCAGTVRLKIRWSDFTTHTRQVSLPQPTDQDGIIFQCALDLLNEIWKDGRPVRLIGVGATRLTPSTHQLTLWDTADQKERRLLDALDDLRQRFGEDAVINGRVLRKKKKE